MQEVASLHERRHDELPSYVMRKEVSDMETTEAVGIETEATTNPVTDPAGGPDSQVDYNGDFSGEQ